jgi:hypothetical protein
MSNEKKECIITPDNKSVFEIDNKKVYFIYSLLFTLNILINMSNGTFSTLMGRIEKELEIQSNSMLGFMSSLFFIGQVIGKLYYFC